MSPHELEAAPRRPDRPRHLRVALLGGGTGLRRLMAGLARFEGGGHSLPPLEITAVIAAGGLRPRPRAGQPVLQALRTADLVVLGPASLERSLLACLRIPGVIAALRRSRGLRVLVTGLAGESPARHLREILDAAGPVIDVALVDESHAAERRGIAAQGVFPLEAHLRDEDGDVHHPERTAAAVLGLAVEALVA